MQTFQMQVISHQLFSHLQEKYHRRQDIIHIIEDHEKTSRIHEEVHLLLRQRRKYTQRISIIQFIHALVEILRILVNQSEIEGPPLLFHRHLKRLEGTMITNILHDRLIDMVAAMKIADLHREMYETTTDLHVIPLAAVVDQHGIRLHQRMIVSM